jgi:hypothetical protein
MYLKRPAYGTKLANIARAILGVHTVRPGYSNEMGMRTTWIGRHSMVIGQTSLSLQPHAEIYGHLIAAILGTRPYAQLSKLYGPLSASPKWTL